MKKTIFLLSLTFFAQLNAKYFSVEIIRNNSTNLSAIVQEVNQAPPPSSFSLSAFNQVQPTSVRYLIDKRASGNLLNLMNNHPLWGLARLQQMLLVAYPDSVASQTIKDSLDNDPDVKSYREILASELLDFSAATKHANKITVPYRAPSFSQSHSYRAVTANIQAAWELSEGMGYIGAVDGGLEVNHPDLRAFDENGNYVGGNLLDGYYHVDTAETSYDSGGNVIAIDLNIDEAQPIPETTANSNCDSNDDADDGWIEGSFLGHGTHVAGILAAKQNNLPNTNSAPGICKNCGLSMMKYQSIKIGSCEPAKNNTNLYYQYNRGSSSSSINAFNALLAVGVNVLNLSSGVSTFQSWPCYSISNFELCYVIKALDKREIIFVAAAGNSRAINLDFPSNEKSVIAVGGLNDQIGSVFRFWNDSISGANQFGHGPLANCPSNHPDTYLTQVTSNEGCGSNSSNYSTNGQLELDHSTDVVMQAQNVYSTLYRGKNYLYLTQHSCTDKYDTNPNDGYGVCTGTSMSAPQVAAIYQLLRSASPLLPNGTRDPDNLIGLRNIMNATADQLAGYPRFEPHFGFGQPNARRALEVVLGKSGGIQMKTRLTPMFHLQSLDELNNVYTPFSQVAVAFLLTDRGYLPSTSSLLVNEFTDFYYDHNDEDINAIPIQFPAPRASFYVFTTNNNPFTGNKDLVPLRRMDITYAGTNRNDTYAVSPAEIQTFHNLGYNYDGIEGYILPTCSPMPQCTPTGATKLWRTEFSSTNHRLIATNTVPPNSTATWLGFVYLNQDSDGDGLIDGQEIILGTNPNVQDTDGDGVGDGVEYPPAAVPVSDPLLGDLIFKHGFE